SRAAIPVLPSLGLRLGPLLPLVVRHGHPRASYPLLELKGSLANPSFPGSVALARAFRSPGGAPLPWLPGPPEGTANENGTRERCKLGSAEVSGPVGSALRADLESGKSSHVEGHVEGHVEEDCARPYGVGADPRSRRRGDPSR